MNTSSKTATLIRQRIESMPLGQPFTPSTFLEYGTRAAVDQAVSRLVKAGSIARVARGVFVRPALNRYVGKVMPEPFKVAETIAQATGATLAVHGAEAARRLELTTQVPTQSVFSTSGPSKRIRMGTTEIRLQHVCERKLMLAGTPAGMALAALWYLGKKEVTPSTIGKIKNKLEAREYRALKAAVGQMPAWMSDALYRFEQAEEHAVA